MDLVPQFPTEEKMILLTECAKFDPAIVSKIKGQLMAGKSVTITSGLLRALQGKGIEDIAELRYTDRKAIVKEFGSWGPRAQAKAEMVIPQIQYLTNDAWEELSAMDETNGWPMLISASYARGTLYVLTIPESFTDLYNLPPTILSRIRDTVTRELPVRVDAPGMVSLFLYDNGTFIVESFLDQPADVTVTVNGQLTALHDLLSTESLSPAANQGPRMPMFGRRDAGPRTTFTTSLKPHSYRAFRYP